MFFLKLTAAQLLFSIGLQAQARLSYCNQELGLICILVFYYAENILQNKLMAMHLGCPPVILYLHMAVTDIIFQNRCVFPDKNLTSLTK